MTWSKHISKTYNREYWYNSETQKSVWEDPNKKVKKQSEIKKSEEKQKERTDTPTQPKGRVVVPTSSYSSNERTTYSIPVANNNGMSWEIEGASHWTKEDYREKLQDLNQAMRDF